MLSLLGLAGRAGTEQQQVVAADRALAIAVVVISARTTTTTRRSRNKKGSLLRIRDKDGHCGRLIFFLTQIARSLSLSVLRDHRARVGRLSIDREQTRRREHHVIR